MFAEAFVDRRLDHRGEQILAAMKQHETAILHQCCASRAEQAGAYRFFANLDVTEEEIAAASYRHCAQAVAGRTVLAIEDTSSIDLTAHAGRVKRTDRQLGPLECPDRVGFFVHPLVVVDAAAEFPLGYAQVAVWNRSWEQPSKASRNYKAQAFEAKESARWVRSVQRGQAWLTAATQVTVIADRESDIYAFVATVPDARTHILIRAAQDRRLAEEPARLFEHLAVQPAQSWYDLEVRGTATREARQAQIEVRFAAVRLQRPATAAANLPATVAMWAIEARECPATVPAGEPPLVWRLLTTHPVHTSAEAIRLIRWYRLRWLIEELFRVLKHQGFNLEASHLETGHALRKLCLFALLAALPILQVTLEREGRYGVSATVVFSEEEVRFQEELQPTLAGRTARQHNPFAPRSLAWSAWIIARLGGWKGYPSQGPAGYITMKRGLERFALVFRGWQLAQAQPNHVFSPPSIGQEKDVCND